MSDSGESGTTSDTGDSSVFSEWSMVDKHGHLGDEDTTSTTSSVEVVDDDDDNDDDDANSVPITPVAGSPASVSPRFILRLPSHKEDVSDTDEDQAESVVSTNVSQEFDPMSGTGATVGLAFRQRTSESRISQEKIEDLRQTIDSLKRNLQQPQVEDSSVSTDDLFRDDHPSISEIMDTETVKPIQDGTVLLKPVTLPTQEQTPSQQETEQDTDTIEEHAGTEGTLNMLLSQLGHYPVKYIAIAGLAAYIGVIIITVTFINKQGPDSSRMTEPNSLLEDYNNIMKTAEQLRISEGELLEKNKRLQKLADQTERLKIREEELLNRNDRLEKLADQTERLKIRQEELLDRNERLQKLADLTEQLKIREGELLHRNERLEKLADQTERLKIREEELLYKNNRLQKLADQTMTDCTEWKQSLAECNSERAKDHEQKIQEMENLRDQAEKDLTQVRNKCQSDLDNLGAQYQSDSNNYRNQYQSDLDRIRKQYQSDLDLVKSNYQSDLDLVKSNYQSSLDSFRMHREAADKYTKSQSAADKNQAQDHCYKDSRNENIKDGAQSKQTVKADRTQSAEKIKDKRKQPTKPKKQKTDFDDTHFRKTKKEEKHDQQSEFNEKSSGNAKSRKQSKRDNSDKESGKGENSSSNWADTVLDMMNKTREQIQDTWAKVKNMSENLWQEHQPTLQTLHESFTRKFQHLSKKFQNKLTRKINKWFRKGKKHGQKESNGQQANTKRRQYRADGDDSNSNRTVEERLVKLSHQVEALNAKKFKKWRESPKVLDIKREFEQVNTLINTADNMQNTENDKLPSVYWTWFNCQFSWWKHLDVVTETNDCYLALCCWQVKVISGDVKQCKKVKKRHGIVKNTCSLQPINQAYTTENNNQNRKTGSAKNTFQESDQKHERQTSTQGTRVGGEPASNDQKEENWFLEIGKEREYERQEPDDWFFRRQNLKASRHKYKDVNVDHFSNDEVDDDDDDYEVNDDDYYYEVNDDDDGGNCDYIGSKRYCFEP